MRRAALFITMFAALPLGAEIDPAPRIRRVALVIGNGDYGDPNLNLPTAVVDAKAVRDKLIDLDFKVLSQMNADVTAFDTLLTQFATAIEHADQALFFYAGHGAQADNRNYLFPVGTGAITAEDIAAKTIDVARVYEILDDGTRRFNLIVLDACRNNPLLAKRGEKECGGWRCGLAKPTGAPAGTIIAFSTGPDMLAATRNAAGRNSPYAAALLKYMGRPGLPILDLFMRVRLDVRGEIPTQVPWENTSQETPFMFRDPAFLETTIRVADDDATVSLNGHSVQWTIDDARMRLIPLEPGDNLLRVTAYNQKTRRGVAGPREGWHYEIALKPYRQAGPTIELRRGEPGATNVSYGRFDLNTGNLEIIEGPGGIPETRWGRGFAAAEVRVRVSDDGVITFPVVEQDVWQDGFSLADPLTSPLERGIAWAVTRKGVRLFDDGMPGALRPSDMLRNELAAAHVPAAGDLSTDSHQRAHKAISAASDDLLLAVIDTARRSERNVRGQYVEDMRWTMARDGRIRAAVVASNFTEARRVFSERQAHDPKVRNSLALLSNGELRDLVQNIP